MRRREGKKEIRGGGKRVGWVVECMGVGMWVGWGCGCGWMSEMGVKMKGVWKCVGDTFIRNILFQVIARGA